MRPDIATCCKNTLITTLRLRKTAAARALVFDRDSLGDIGVNLGWNEASKLARDPEGFHSEENQVLRSNEADPA
jgi:hypothetical protein